MRAGGDDARMNQNTSVVSEPDQRPSRESAAMRWRKLVEDQRASGLPVSAFCRERGISQASLFAWRRRLSQSQRAGFAQVKLRPKRRAKINSQPAQDQPAACIELCLSGNRRLILHPGFDRRLLLEIISALESSGDGSEQRS